MTNGELLTQIRSRQAVNPRACFDLAERDLMQILCSSPRHAVYVLQQRLPLRYRRCQGRLNELRAALCGWSQHS